MSTDHPNGGSFLAYPQIIALLMDRERRKETLARLPARVRERCTLGALDRQYTLAEVAIITRAAPARILGLTTKGHLGIGADADVTVYQPAADLERMFSLPRYVIHSGRIVVDDGEIQPHDTGKLLRVGPQFDVECLPDMRRWLEQRSSLRFENLSIEDELLGRHQTVEALPRL